VDDESRKLAELAAKFGRLAGMTDEVGGDLEAVSRR